MTDTQKNCIESMVLGFMGIDDACAIANCTPEDFETPECKAYAKQYGDEFDIYQLASVWEDYIKSRESEYLLHKRFPNDYDLPF